MKSPRFDAQGSNNNFVDTSDLSMVPIRDDLSLHTSNEPPKRQTSNREDMPIVQSAPANTITASWFFVVVIALFLLAAIGVLGAMHMQQQISLLTSQLNNSSAALEASKQNFSELNSKLSATGENVSKSGSEAQKQLATLKDEINRLNDVENNKNKTAIDNAARTLNVQKDMISAHEEGLKKVNDQLVSMSTELANFKSSLTKMNETNNSQSNSYSELKQQLVELDGQISSIRAELQKSTQAEGLTQKVSDLEEAVRSFDAFRRQTNASLSQLNADVQLMNERQGK